MKALVLSGGGARGAYQAGVLLAIADIVKETGLNNPFAIYTGVSAGAINAAFLAAGTDFTTAAQELAKLWSALHSEMIFKTDAVSLGKMGLNWVGRLSFGSLNAAGQVQSLLNTSPLEDLIKNNINFHQIQRNIENKKFSSIAVTAMDYKNSESITFVQGDKDTPEWQRARRRSEPAQLGTEHILASSAIPLLFTPAGVDHRYFGDGCVRNVMPLSPAVHLGASSLMIIGVRKINTSEDPAPIKPDHPPSIARVVNVLLNSVLLDGIEVDIERLRRINHFLLQVPEEFHAGLNFKSIDYVWIHPSEDIGHIAASMTSRLPRVIRYLLKGMGPLDDAAEIISYLLFEPEFCRKLIEVGHADGMRQKLEIIHFLKSP